MLPTLFIIAASVAAAHAASDPCTIASASTWVSSEAAHALAVIDTNIKALPWYSSETWYIHSPNPLIPHDVNISSLLLAVQDQVSTVGYTSDWDFNMAITDAFNREADGHTAFVASCTEAFRYVLPIPDFNLGTAVYVSPSYNLPFSIAILASTPTSPMADVIFFANYDFVNEARSGLEAYYESLGVHVRPYDGARIISIDGVDAATYLLDLAAKNDIYTGNIGGYETVQARYARLMTRYSADTTSGGYTQELGRFSQRVFYPGTDPHAGVADHKRVGDTCAACTLPPLATTKRREVRPAGSFSGGLGVVAADTQETIQAAAVATLADATSSVNPNLTSFGHITFLDIYQLAVHPKNGVVYLEGFLPRDGTDFQTYMNGLSATLYTGITQLKNAGVKHILIDISGNRGGYVAAGAVAIWSLFPTDLYPGFPAVSRNHDLARQESVAEATSQNPTSEYFYGLYRDLNYNLFKNNSQFMETPIPQTINGIADAFSHPFFDDFGTASDLTNFTAPPFDAVDLVMISNGVCASTCSIFSSYLFQKHNVRSAVFSGPPTAATAQFDAGVKGSEITDQASMLVELELAGLADAPGSPQPFPIRASLSLNFRHVFPYVDAEDGIFEFVWEQATKKYLSVHEGVVQQPASDMGICRRGILWT
ncbi:hypothetical protein B0H19DRAFT_1332693 [Mycena capillaripes]|nr:hypothetical protein B0H19DRAFT_1332693 [Mycena capillaripes]